MINCPKKKPKGEKIEKFEGNFSLTKSWSGEAKDSPPMDTMKWLRCSVIYALPCVTSSYACTHTYTLTLFTCTHTYIHTYTRSLYPHVCVQVPTARPPSFAKVSAR